MNNLSIKKKLIVGLCAILAVMFALLVLAYNNFTRLSEANKRDRHTLEVLLESDRIATSILQIHTSTRGYLLTANEQLVAPIETEYASARRHLARAMQLTAGYPHQLELFRSLEPMLTRWMNTRVMPQIENRRQLERSQAALSQRDAEAIVTRGTQAVAEMRRVLEQVESEENRLLRNRADESAELRRSMTAILTAGGVFCAMLAIVIGVLMVRAISIPLDRLREAARRIGAGDQAARAEVVSQDELGAVALEFNRMAQAIQDNQAKEHASNAALRAKVDSVLAVVSRAASGDLTGSVTVRGDDAIGQLGQALDEMFDHLRALLHNVQRAGIQVTTSATQIAASAHQQEATSVEQAQTSVEVLSTTKEISANTQQLLHTMEDATRVAERTTGATAEAQDNLRRMDLAMQQMVTATDSVGAKLATLSDKASNINSVLSTITKVADQTNILSLNAAIEAERAGEAGRGFAVVASEIRRLADQTSASTWDIEQMVKEMQSAVSASVMGMDKFAEEIRRGVAEARNMASQLTSVMEQVRTFVPSFELVLQGMQAQATGASQISETMMQLSDASQHTVESLRATSEAVHQLQYAASELQSSVANFSVNT